MTDADGALTLSELIEHAGLDLPLRTGRIGLGSVIEGIHLSDLEDPTPWMTPGMVLITTGRLFAEDIEVGRRLLDRLADIGTVAVGMGVGHYLDDVPAPIVEHAAELGIAVFVAPLQVPFRAIVGYVYDALASRDMHRLRRMLAVQGHLLDLLVEERGVGEVIAQLGDLLEMKVVLFDSAGRLLAEAGPGSDDSLPARMWHAYVESGAAIGPLGVLECDDERFRYREIVAHGVTERVLAAAATFPTPVEFADMALTFAQKLLTLDLLRASEEAMQRRRMRSLLLDDLVTGSGSAADFRLRLKHQRIDADVPWRIVVCDIDAFQAASSSAGAGDEAGRFEIKARLVNALDGFFMAHGDPHLSMSKADEAVALVSAERRHPDEVRRQLSVLQASLESSIGPLTISIGASSPHAGVDEAARALWQAREALRVGRRSIGRRVVMLYEDVQRHLGFLDDEAEAVGALQTRLLGPLDAYDRRHRTDLVQTLCCYLGNRLSAHHTAEELVVHRNTLLKRLRRIEELSHVDLDDMEDVVALYIATRERSESQQAG